MIKSFPSKMIFPLRGQSEQFRGKLNHLDKLHSKSYKQKRNVIKQKKTDLKKVEKKLCNKGRIFIMYYVAIPKIPFFRENLAFYLDKVSNNFKH